MRAGRQRRAPVHRTDGDHDGEVADLQVADPVLDRQRDDVVALGGLLARSGRSAASRARVLGVVEGDDIGALVMIADHADEERDPADRRVGHQAAAAGPRSAATSLMLASRTGR